MPNYKTQYAVRFGVQANKEWYVEANSETEAIEKFKTTDYGKRGEPIAGVRKVN